MSNEKASANSAAKLNDVKVAWDNIYNDLARPNEVKMAWDDIHDDSARLNDVKVAWDNIYNDSARPSNLSDDAIRHQNYVDSLQMEREKRMAEERDAQEKARRRRQEEIRLREEERIRKMKNSWKFRYWKSFMKNLYNTNEELEKAVLEQIEKDEDDIPNNPPPGGWLPFK